MLWSYVFLALTHRYNLDLTFTEINNGHYCDVIMGMMASQITSLTIVYSTAHSGTDKRKHQSSASLAFVRRTHRWQVNSSHKWPLMRKKFPFDDVIMEWPPTPKKLATPWDTQYAMWIYLLVLVLGRYTKVPFINLWNVDINEWVSARKM